jgi:poly-beta-1,6-N-acetyl-D-glucosamine synthase
MLPTYVLITPARNEAMFIESTIKSVVAQTILPVKWVIVSDGSTDGTDDIVRKYSVAFPWVELVCLPDCRERNFAGKVNAFNAGQARIIDLEYDVIGSMDADISFDKNYFSFLLEKLYGDPNLGLVGTPFKEDSEPIYNYRIVNIEHVSGGCQLFRRECFLQIGGYEPVKGGCIDHIAVITARMKGWKTRTFTEKCYLHHRKMGTAQNSLLLSKFKNGCKDYAIGNHPMWEIVRTIYQIGKRPFFIGGILLLLGYIWSFIKNENRPVSRELVQFYRREQMCRLKSHLKSH